MSITVYCSKHDVEALTPTLRKLLEVASIVFLENAGNLGASMDRLLDEQIMALVFGRVTPETFTNPGEPQYEFRLGLLRMIFNIQKPAYVEHSPLTLRESQELVHRPREVPKEST